MSDAETLRHAAASLRIDFSDPSADPFENGVADLLDVTAEHIESHDCEAHCEPNGCAPVKHALVLARAWLEEVSS